VFYVAILLSIHLDIWGSSCEHVLCIFFLSCRLDTASSWDWSTVLEFLYLWFNLLWNQFFQQNGGLDGEIQTSENDLL